jgi:hypothetical protein
MPRFTIKKMKQPSYGAASKMKEGQPFYRVKRDGVTIQDFRKKSTATAFVNHKRSKEN